MATHSSAPARGAALLADPLLNKGTAFTARERAALGLLAGCDGVLVYDDAGVMRFRAWRNLSGGCLSTRGGCGCGRSRG